jgi:hypothetical protein
VGEARDGLGVAALNVARKGWRPVSAASRIRDPQDYHCCPKVVSGSPTVRVDFERVCPYCGETCSETNSCRSVF